MPYAIVIWKRGSNVIDIAGLKPEDLQYLEKIPCMSSRFEVDSEGFVRFGNPSCSTSSLAVPIPSTNSSKFKNSLKTITIKPAVILTGLEVLGFKVVTTTASPCTITKGETNIACTEYSWTLRRDFSEPEPQD